MDFSVMTLDQGRQHVKFANSFTRLGMVIELSWQMEESDWFTLLGEQWSTCDNIGLLMEDLMDTPFGDAVHDPDVWRDDMMTADERAAYQALPDLLTVYRGCYKNNKWGVSWSLEREMAASFPFRHRYQQDDQALLVKATIPKSKVVALKGDRGEAEIICWYPKHVSTSKLRR